MFYTNEHIEVFLRHGQAFIPNREEQIETICSLIPVSEGQMLLLDIGCGEGLMMQALLDNFPQSKVVGIDRIPHMVKQTRQRLLRYGDRFEVVQHDLADSFHMEGERRYHAAISCLTLNSLSDQEKQNMLHKVAAILVRGGVFIVADLVHYEMPQGVEFAAKKWNQIVHKRSFELTGGTMAYDAFLNMRWNCFANPSHACKIASQKQYLEWLEKAGFKGLDIVWLRAGHAIFCGYVS